MAEQISLTVSGDQRELDVEPRRLLVQGSDGSSGALVVAAEHATDGVTVNSDIHADREYRSRMAVVDTRRSIETALSRLT